MNVKEATPPFLLILTSLIWAGSFIAVGLTVDEVPPVMLAFLRFLVATPLMIGIVFFKKQKLLLPKKEWGHVFLLGLTGVTFIYIFQFNGVYLTTPATASILINTNVILIAILSRFFLKEQFSIWKMMGIPLSFFGVIIIIVGQMNNETLTVDNSFLLGCLLVLASALCWAIYSIIGKNLLKKYDPLKVTANAFLFGTLCYIPFMIPYLSYDVSNISFSGLIAILYLGVFCSVIGYLIWYVILSKQDAARTAVFLTLIPFFTIILSMVFVGEKMTFLFFIGAMFIMCGVYLTQKKVK